MSKIVFVCPLSNTRIRQSLQLKDYKIYNLLMRCLGRSERHYSDIASWVTEYIRTFEKDKENEYHIIAFHQGMKNKIQTFSLNGIYYYFINSSHSLAHSFLNKKWHIDEKNNYIKNRNVIIKEINNIKPDLVVVCGAENPRYSLVSLDVKNCPVFVMMQTLLNAPQRIQMGVGSPYRREKEMQILSSLIYYGTAGEKTKMFIHTINPGANIFRIAFPASKPPFSLDRANGADFVMNARVLTKFKGVEDVLKALGIVAKKYPDVRLELIGHVDVKYKKVLNEIMLSANIGNNVVFKGHYEEIEDMYYQVQKSKFMILPGITAGFNTTVREGMMMKMPIIMYETPVSVKINEMEESLLCAKMQDVNDLANKMIFAMENMDKMSSIAENAYNYAMKNYSSQAVTEQLIKVFNAIINKDKGIEIPKELLI